VNEDVECVCLPMEFAPCSACTRDRASCDQCFWVKEARRQATIEREAEAALDAADRPRDIPESGTQIIDVCATCGEVARLRRIEAAARLVTEPTTHSVFRATHGERLKALEKALEAK